MDSQCNKDAIERKPARLRVLQIAKTRASAAYAVLRDVAQGVESDEALLLVEQQLRLALLAVRREILMRGRLKASAA